MGKTMNSRTALRAAAAGAICLAAGLIACDGGQDSRPPRKVPQVRAETAARGPIEQILELTGSVQPYRSTRLASPAEGPVRDLRVREGDRVRAGQTLLSIGRTEGIDAQVASLREQLRVEDDNLRRVRLLVESGAVAAERLDEAEAARERARAQLAAAEEQARDYVVTAPWNGVVWSLDVAEGDFAAPRAALLRLYDPTTLVILASVPERHAGRMETGMAADIVLDARPGETIRGRIARVYAGLDERTRTRTVEIETLEKVELLPGMFARLAIRLAHEDSAVVVPSGAVLVTPAGERIAWVVKNGRAAPRRIETGIERDGRIQIVRGVEAGDSIITAGNEKLRDGAAVQPIGGGDGKGRSGRPAGARKKPGEKTGDGGQ